MKAVICTQYGGPEVLQIQDVRKPMPNDDQILIKIVATAVNSGDVRVRKLEVSGFMRIVMRLVLGIFKPRKPILGTVFSGIVERKGKNVTKFDVGDKVFGMTGFKFGTHAEYVAVNQNSSVLEMPDNATFEEAAAIVFGGQTAIHYLLKTKISEKPNSKVLIVGSTGSVGTAAIQIAKHHGAVVTAVCSSDGHELVAKLGVNEIFHYNTEDFTKRLDEFDVIFDTIGKYNRSQFKHHIKKDGMYLSVNYGYASENIQQLQLLKALFESGELLAAIDRTYKIEDVIDAHRYVETGRKKGNVVLRICQ